MEKRNSLTIVLLKAYDRMLKHFGPRHWWPAETPFEVIVGAILTQNTAWINVEKAIQNLKSARVLSLKGLLEMPEKNLSILIRPSGYFNLKAKRLKSMVHFIAETYDGDLEKMSQAPLQILRKQLLNVYGVGEETADSILLYALGKPIFVIDAYTRRILSRHHLAEPNMTYAQIQHLFMETLPTQVSLFREYHALIVETGKTYCRRTPRCSECPLFKWPPPPA